MLTIGSVFRYQRESVSRMESWDPRGLWPLKDSRKKGGMIYVRIFIPSA